MQVIGNYAAVIASTQTKYGFGTYGNVDSCGFDANIGSGNLTADFGIISGTPTNTRFGSTNTGVGWPAVSVNSQSGTGASAYTLVITDGGEVIEMTGASAATVTIPTNASVAFAIGTVIELCQVGAGQVTVAAAGGVTLDNPSSVTTRAQWSTIGLRKRGTNEWVLSGDLT